MLLGTMKIIEKNRVPFLVRAKTKRVRAADKTIASKNYRKIYADVPNQSALQADSHLPTNDARNFLSNNINSDLFSIQSNTLQFTIKKFHVDHFIALVLLSCPDTLEKFRLNFFSSGFSYRRCTATDGGD